MKARSSIRALESFLLSLLLVIVFALGYMFSADWVASAVPERGGLASVWLPPAVISSVCAIFGAAMMLLLKDRRLIPSSFVYLLLYCAIAYAVVLLNTQGVERQAAIQFVRLFFLTPAIVGNLVANAVYFALRRRQRGKQSRRDQAHRGD